MTSGSSKYVDEARQWYHEVQGINDSLREAVQDILRQSLENGKVVHLYVTSRLKSEESFLKKIQSKQDLRDAFDYHDVRDLVGVRVMVALRPHREDIGKVIHEIFTVDEDESVNKEAELGQNEMGYRAEHWVAKLGPVRCALSEYKKFSGLFFEIQVCSILAHAWSEIEHSGYKLGKNLPPEVVRKYKALAGTIEVAEIVFESLDKEIGKYATEVKEEVSADVLSENFLEQKINSLNLHAFLEAKFVELENVDWGYQNEDNDEFYIEAMTKMGISMIGKLNDAIHENFIDLLKKFNVPYLETYSLLFYIFLIWNANDFNKCYKNPEFPFLLGETELEMLKEGGFERENFKGSIKIYPSSFVPPDYS